jgi:putative methionine-R-sulfoxide reductase with GAF domain
MKTQNADTNSQTQFAPDYIENKDLIERARQRGHFRLRMPASLENQFTNHFTQLSRRSFLAAFVFICLPFILAVLLVTFHISGLELLELSKYAFKNTFTTEISFEGIEGLIRIHFFIILIILSMIYLPKNKHIQDSFQLFLSLTASSILALIMISYALIDDQRFVFTLELELIVAYLFLFTLLRLQVLFVLLASLLATIIFLMSISVLLLVPDWEKLVSIFIFMNVFGFIYNYQREIEDRKQFINTFEIQNEKMQLTFLNQKTKRENQLKADLSAFYVAMSGEKNLNMLGEKILGFVIPKVSANIASLYLLEKSTDEKTKAQLQLIAKYGIAKEQQLRTKIVLGEGLLGQAVHEKKNIILDHPPEDFHILQTGLGKINAPALCILPLMFDDEVIAAVEIASIKPIDEYHLEFLRAASRSIATALKAVSARSN